ncbi:MAG: KGK domain-containing protein [Cyanobacteria bacterium J06631_6]
MSDKLEVNTNEYLSRCDSRDIISFDSRNPIYVHKVFDLVYSALNKQLDRYVAQLINQKLERKCDASTWLEDGEKCEILRANSLGWQKGIMKIKINVSLEFVPDEPEETASPLDDVRQE